MEIFRQLGDRLEACWRDRDYDERAFPKLAAAALKEADLVAQVTPLDLLRWIGRESVLPAQSDPNSALGDMAVTLYSTPRFYISALFWLHSSTAIHQHSFSGAFQVLAGSSLQTRHLFTEERFVNGRLRFGTLDPAGVTLLPTGSVEPITSGSRFVHSLFHLEHPSVSLVIRTHSEPAAQPQWSFLPGGIAFDPFVSNVVTQKKREALRVLRALGPDTAVREAAEMFEQADLQLTWELLGECMALFGPSALERNYGLREDKSADRLEPLLAVARRRHGVEAVARFLQVSDESRRLNGIIAMREAVTQPEHRFLIGVLLNVGDARTALDLLAQRYPDRDPVEEFLDRIHEVSATKVLGSNASNMLGIADYDLEHRIVLSRFLRGGSFEEAAADLRRAFPDESAEALDVVALEVAGALSGTPILRPLFQGWMPG